MLHITQGTWTKIYKYAITNVILSHSWRTYFRTFILASKLCHSFPFYPRRSIRYENIYKVGGVNALFASGANGVSLVKEKFG